MRSGVPGDWAEREREVSVTVCTIKNLDSFPPTKLNTNSSAFIVSSLSLQEKF